MSFRSKSIYSVPALKKSVNSDELFLNTEWTYGQLKVVYNNIDLDEKSKWISTPIGKFNTVQNMWKFLNNTLYEISIDNTKPNSSPIIKLKFHMKTHTLTEVWFFKNDGAPDWDIAKTKSVTGKVIEIKILYPSDKFVQNVLLLAFGEMIPRADSIMGVRVRPSYRGGDIRLWIMHENAIDKISTTPCN